ncbi:16S rRNA (adenine(1518)-N(6)/adenine(1519)-N(6))-dimethyltransferase RsmA [Psittacicella hinzii]|uniref:Ribosomal RNA small subunit methyltransferase A n=1 Tax=Psittacicella hinzii TaxID=2028575 RepID=A0A3A1YD57_9GAMM|nr:16S rRNA (adenine(1518)-N(6)/adenine(1519)-N(6))-dimethyltransferase RsmA [Psittacicella hinzii]RIY35100.1 16S rRNA (adenine(1518)-N(6)/adenine(1519)-N(6))-dimethyltransferase [Psittacicella hinzii]
MQHNKQHLGHFAKKRFGQNFLIDQNIIYAIVDAINPKNEDNLIEIGPGLAALTEPVCERVDHLTVVEVDKDLIERLQHHPFLAPKLTIIAQDVLNVNFHELATPERKAKVFGNLPYNISTPLILQLLNHTDVVAEMTFMLQLEVVERLLATKGSKHYGRLGIITQYYCDVLPVIEVPPESFKPAPKVNSAVVKLVPKKEIKHPVVSIDTFQTITALAFSQRRKTIKNSLSKLVYEQDWQNLSAFGINSNMRAEELSLEQYVNLENYISNNGLFNRLQN